MATTTNYGWTTPDDTDLVKDGAAAIRTLGSSIDTTTKNLNPETTTGDIAYRSATANTNTRLALGTAGQVLTVNSGATAPEWAAPASGGKVLQVVSATNATSTSIASASFNDTSLSVSITPSAATSKVMVLVTQGWQSSRSDSGMDFAFRLNRDSTTVYAPHQTSNIITIGYSLSGVTAINGLQGVMPITYLDSPASTSALTYKTQASLRTTSNSGVLTMQASGFTSSIIAIEIGA
jgi:hypothetical protein